MTERELLVDCLQRLNRVGIPYMLTGSMVSNYWGIPRTTHDLDFVIQLPDRFIKPLVEAFSKDFVLEEEDIHRAFRNTHLFNAIDMRSALKVDFWLLQPNPFERTMFDRKLQVSLFGEQAWICTAEDVILHKLHWNSISPSDRQLGDSAGVWAVQAGGLDLAYLKIWAGELGVASTLDDLLSGRIRPKNT